MITIQKTINATDTTLMISNDTEFSDTGVVKIDNEIITYSSRFQKTLYGCTRGAQSTVAASHTIGSLLILIDYFSSVFNGGSGTVSPGLTGAFSYYPSDGTTIDDSAALTTDGTDIFVENNLTINSGQLLLPDGTGDIPAYAFANETNTGMLRGGTGILTFVINASSTGTQMGLNDADHCLQLRAGTNIRLYDAGDSFCYILSAPSLGSNLTFQLPNTAGNSGESLKTDGAGNLYWG